MPNAYWTVHPGEILPAGSYTVIDSHPASWSRNDGSQQRGFTRVEGYPSGDQAGLSIEQQTEQALQTLERMFRK